MALRNQRFRRSGGAPPPERRLFWRIFWWSIGPLLFVLFLDFGCDLVEELVRPSERCLRCTARSEDRIPRCCNPERSFAFRRPNRTCPDCGDVFQTSQPYYLSPIRSIVREHFGTLELR